MIPIDKGIEMPRHRCQYPFADMEVGDSFFTKKARTTITGIAGYWAKKLGASFSSRDVVEKGVEGTRVWRTK